VTAIEPWQVWWVNFDPTAGHEQAGKRPAVVVSSRFHLAVSGGALVSVLPLTTRERPGWVHRVPVAGRGKDRGFAITEQVRTVARTRLVGHRPAWVLTDDEITETRTVLAKMLDLVAE
jgi:mRNA interferase MazF